MYLFSGLLLAIFLIVSHPVVFAETQMDIGMSIGDEGVKSFYFAMGNYYKVPQQEVVFVHDRGIPIEEMPVVLFIANKRSIKPSAVIDLRLHGRTWLDVMIGFGLSPEILYVPVKEVYGPPYGKAYGYYKKKPKKQWKTIILSDEDVVNLVNLKFISEHYGYSPDAVIKLRSQGKGFVVINKEVKKAKGKKAEIKQKNEKKQKDSPGKGHGKKEK
jgi:hypothetical protein